jgi:hypothetical protein
MRNSERDLEARRKAQALWDEHKKRDEKVLKEKDKERASWLEAPRRWSHHPLTRSQTSITTSPPSRT